jgi:hypothetical protein
MSLNVDMHVDNSPYFFVEFFIFDGLGKKRNILPFLVKEKFGKELFECVFNAFVWDLRYEWWAKNEERLLRMEKYLFVVKANGLVCEVFVDFF